jgi:YebC/PmpR family DNA-binding regulatory protein
MSHSKWAKTEYKKAASDAKKSKMFTKVVKLIITEAKKSNGNKESPGLKSAIEKARNVDMPNDNIERAIKKATESGSQMENITYEAYGPGGVGMIIEALTENRNKAAQEVRHILTKNGYELGVMGSVSWGFEKKIDGDGINWIPTLTIPVNEEDSPLLEKIIDELEDNDEVQSVFTNAE